MEQQNNRSNKIVRACGELRMIAKVDRNVNQKRGVGRPRGNTAGILGVRRGDSGMMRG